MKKLIVNIIGFTLFAIWAVWMVNNITKDPKNSVIRLKFDNDEQVPIVVTAYRGKVHADEYWFTDTLYHIGILFFRIGKQYSVKFQRAEQTKWLFLDATEPSNHDLKIDFNNTIGTKKEILS